MKVRSCFLARDAAKVQHAKLVRDTEKGQIEIFGITDLHWKLAGQSSQCYGYTDRLRTLDSIQLAVALDLAEQRLLDLFVVTDRVLADIATREGLTVLNPAA
jgi:hypothetical protein